MQKVKTKEFCGYITDYSGPFGTCIRNSRVDQNSMYRDCVYDVCSYMHNPTKAREAACGALDKLVTSCTAVNVEFKPWRSADFCRKFSTRKQKTIRGDHEIIESLSVEEETINKSRHEP